MSQKSAFDRLPVVEYILFCPVRLYVCQGVVSVFFTLHHGRVSVNDFAVQVYDKSFTSGHKHFVLYAE